MSIWHRTKPTRSSDRDRLATVALVILHKYIGAQPWKFVANKGSVTLCHMNARHDYEQMVCFVDVGDELWRKAGLHLSDHEPMAVAINLVGFPQLIQDQMRQWLLQQFPGRYIQHDMVELAMGRGRSYDVVFLHPGDCPKADLDAVDQEKRERLIDDLAKKSKSPEAEEDSNEEG